MELVLIRHTSVDVPPGVCYGQTDVPLKDSFEDEAAHTQLLLQPYAPFDAVYTSPLTRCTRLAERCGYPAARRDQRLLELDFGEWEMQAFDGIRDPRLQEWYDDYLHVAPTGGESFQQQYARVSHFLEELKGKPYRRAAVFAHGGVLLCARLYAGELTPDQLFGSLTPYGGVVCLQL